MIALFILILLIQIYMAPVDQGSVPLQLTTCPMKIGFGKLKNERIPTPNSQASYFFFRDELLVLGSVSQVIHRILWYILLVVDYIILWKLFFFTRKNSLWNCHFWGSLFLETYHILWIITHGPYLKYVSYSFGGDPLSHLYCWYCWLASLPTVDWYGECCYSTLICVSYEVCSSRLMLIVTRVSLCICICKYVWSSRQVPSLIMPSTTKSVAVIEHSRFCVSVQSIWHVPLQIR